MTTPIDFPLTNQTVTFMRQAIHDELQPLLSKQDQAMRQQAALVAQLAKDLDQTQAALARTRGALKGHAEGFNKALFYMVAPVIKATTIGIGLLIIARYGLPL